MTDESRGMVQKQIPANELIVIAGPTGAGKTVVAVELAKLIGAEIISADSMQVYQHLSIGTAKPRPEETKGIPYHLIDFVDPNLQYNLGNFVSDAEKTIEAIGQRKKRVIICGGTGMYIRGLLLGIFDEESRDIEFRKVLEKRAEEEGLHRLFVELKEIDPASKIMSNDRKRIIRALEVFKVTGKRLSDLHLQDEQQPQFPSRFFILDVPRDLLYSRIDDRAEQMLDEGLVNEVRQYLDCGYSEDNPCIRALGYAEIISYIRGKIELSSAMEEMKRKTRNYAKRQMTWFRSVANASRISTDGYTPGEIASRICDQLGG